MLLGVEKDLYEVLMRLGVESLGWLLCQPGGDEGVYVVDVGGSDGVLVSESAEVGGDEKD